MSLPTLEEVLEAKETLGVEIIRGKFFDVDGERYTHCCPLTTVALRKQGCVHRPYFAQFPVGRTVICDTLKITPLELASFLVGFDSQPLGFAALLLLDVDSWRRGREFRIHFFGGTYDVPFVKE